MKDKEYVGYDMGHGSTMPRSSVGKNMILNTIVNHKASANEAAKKFQKGWKYHENAGLKADITIQKIKSGEAKDEN